jgi:hypothetical protein
MSTEAERGHLLIGMVLADIFLLVLLIVWWGYRNDRDAPLETSRLREQVERLTKDNASLTAHLRHQQELQERYEQMRRILERLSVAAGMGNADPGTLEADGLLAALRRGAAACLSTSGQNVAIRVWSSQDSDQVEVLSGGFAKAIGLGAEVSVGSRLDGPQAAHLLAATRQLYSQRRAAGSECRFDYSLMWAEDSGYRRARETFEAVFYPARISRRTE